MSEIVFTTIQAGTGGGILKYCHAQPQPDPAIAQLVPGGDDPLAWGSYQFDFQLGELYVLMVVHAQPYQQRPLRYWVELRNKEDFLDILGPFMDSAPIPIQDAHHIGNQIHFTLITANDDPAPAAVITSIEFGRLVL